MGTKELRQLLGEGELGKVLENLRENVIDTDQLNLVTSLSFRFSQLKRQQMHGTDDSASSKQEQNQIVNALISLIDELEKQAIKFLPNTSTQQQKSPMLRAYLSVGTPHEEKQAQFLDFLRNYFRLKGVQLETIGATSYSSRKPLIPIKQKLEAVSGCVVLATERFTTTDGFFRKDSPKEEHVPEIFFTTAWTHIEAAMAYQLGLPLLILREKKVRSEGMIDPSVHEWNVYEIDLNNHEALSNGLLKPVIDGWIEEIADFERNRR